MVYFCHAKAGKHKGSKGDLGTLDIQAVDKIPSYSGHIIT